MADAETARPVVLIVDDEEHMRDSLSLVVSDRYQVVLASTGREGLETATRRMPNLVLADLKLPDMPGFELIRRLRSELPELRILAISGVFRDSRTVVECWRAGADLFLEKDLLNPDFANKILAWQHYGF